MSGKKFLYISRAYIYTCGKSLFFFGSSSFFVPAEKKKEKISFFFCELKKLFIFVV